MFFDDGPGLEAKRVCVECPIQLECLDWAVRRGEREGIWGGAGADRRRFVEVALATGSALEYHRALAAVQEELVRVVAGIDDREPQPEGVCERCGARRRGGVLPFDRNGPGARCGLPGTYNKGCRCDPCVEAKAGWQAEAKARRAAADASPRGEDGR